MNRVRVVALLTCLGLTAPAADAQIRPFAYSIATGTVDGTSDSRRSTAYYDAGYAERTGEPFGYDGVEQRFGFQGRLGHGLTVVARVGLGLDAQATRSTQEAEILKDVLGPSSRVQLALGVGGRREWSGDATALGRVSLGWTAGRTLLCGNARFEKPFSQDRDSIDVITTFGAMREVGGGLRVGIEAVGEDLEGFWDETEAEGGAKLYAGPALHWTEPQGRLWAAMGGGPIFYATRSGLTSPAPRELQAGGSGYTVRVSLGYVF